MHQLSQLVENIENAGKIYYACSVTLPLNPTRIRLVQHKEILNEQAFKNNPTELLAVIVDETGEIPNPSKFKSIPTFYKNGIVLFDTHEKALDEFSKYWRKSNVE